MATFFLLLGIACAPAILGCILTFPLWFFRSVSNDTINRTSLIMMALALLVCYILIFLDETLQLGFLFIPLSLVNLPLQRVYTRVLYTRRCPACHTSKLRIAGRNGRKYKLKCPQCGLDISWKL